MPIPLVTRILVADDFAIVREGLKKVLNAKPDLEVVAEAEDGREAVDKALKEDVHLAVLDVSMPRMTGIQAAAELHKRKPELKTLMLSMHDSEQFLFEALKAMAHARAAIDRAQALVSQERCGADTEILEGNPAEQIVELARARNAPLIVVGSRGLGAVTGALLGSVSSAIIHRADRPVLVVPRPSEP